MENAIDPLSRLADQASSAPRQVETKKKSRRAELALAVLVIAFIIVNARWIWLFCHDQVLDIDESGYLMVALAFYHSLIDGGIFGWFNAVENLVTYAPLTTAMSSLLFVITGPHAVFGFAIPLLAGVIVVITTYYLGKSLGSTWIGLLSSLLVASSPIVINYSRNFHFAMPATAAMTAALLALIRSDRFRRSGWSILFGVCVGLLPLARTMTIAFVPGLLIAACFHAGAAPDRKKSFLTLSVTAFVAVVTAAVWYGPNAEQVFGYLFSYGYGAQSAEYGGQSSPFQLEAWSKIIGDFVGYLYLPHFFVLLAGAAAMVIVSLRGLVQHGCPTIRQALGSKWIAILLCIGEALAALTSSISGSAFIAPVVPAAIVLAVAALYDISPENAGYHRALGATACLVAVVALAPLLDLTLVIARPWTVTVPFLGQSVVTNGRGGNQTYQAAGGFTTENPALPISTEQSKSWLELSTKTAEAIVRQGGDKNVTAFGFRHYVYNVNTVVLQRVITKGALLPVRQVAPTLTGSNTSGYLTWLMEGDSADACLLLTMSSDRAQFVPLVIPEYMREAALQAKFVAVESWSTPDDQEVTLWKRSTPRCTSPS